MRRRTFLATAATALAAPAIPRPSIAQPGRVSTLRFVPQSNLFGRSDLDDGHRHRQSRLLRVGHALRRGQPARPQPQMAEGHRSRMTGAAGASGCATGWCSTTARPFAPSTAPRAWDAGRARPRSDSSWPSRRPLGDAATTGRS